MKERTINIVFAILSAACGVALFVFGLKEAAVDTDVAVDENVIDTMAITIPGLLLIADSVMYLLRPKFRTDLRFLFGNLGIVALVGFIAEVVYFQFIHYGIHRPQVKMLVPAILIILAYGVFILVLGGLFLCVRKAAGLTKK
ncbi:MAG: hypothetical protein J6Y67_06115 [Lachnospiraceae bacterium]|nr:hypothetical protein [Lachnospiraceae bacterium]